MTEEEFLRRRNEAIEADKQRRKAAPPKPIEEEEEEEEPDTFFDNVYKPPVETVKDRRATDPLPRTSSCERVSRLNINYTVQPVSQPKSLPIGKVMRWGKLLTDHCPWYYINEALANCRSISANECRCVGLLNRLMRKHDYAYASDHQLAHWLGLASPRCAANMLSKLIKKGFIKDIGDKRGSNKIVVCPQWRDSTKEPEVPF